MTSLTRFLLAIKESLIKWRIQINLWFHFFTKPQRGITIIAHLSGAWSFGKVMRDMAFSLQEAGIPFQTYNTGLRYDVPRKDLIPILTPRWRFNAKKYDHVLEIVESPFPDNVAGIKKSTAFFWEFDTGCAQAWPEMLQCHEAVAFSDYNKDVFRKTLPDNISVQKILYPLRLTFGEMEPAETIRRRYNIPQEVFAVFFNFSYSSGIGRKNPEGTIRAFAQAFRDTPDAWLVFKTMQSRSCPTKVAYIRSILEQEGLGNRFISIDAYVPQQDLYGITNACDAYISLHRGEGFGLGIAEAMSLGKPVIVTNYSSSTEFCNNENSIPIPFQMQKPREEDLDCGPFHNVTLWPEPDINAAARALRQLYEDPEFAVRLGNAAKSFISEHFSLDNFRKSVENFLKT